MKMSKQQVKRWLEEGENICVRAYWHPDGEIGIDEEDELELGDRKIDTAIWEVLHTAQLQIGFLLEQWAEGKELHYEK